MKGSRNAKRYMKAFGTCLKVLKAITKHNESFRRGLKLLKDVGNFLPQVSKFQKLTSSIMNHL